MALSFNGIKDVLGSKAAWLLWLLVGFAAVGVIVLLKTFWYVVVIGGALFVLHEVFAVATGKSDRSILKKTFVRLMG